MTDERGTVKHGGTVQDRRMSVSYWKQTGVIARWKLVAVYVSMIALAGAGLYSVDNQADSNCRRIHRIVSAGNDILDLSSLPPEVRAKWRSADCPTP